MSHPQEHIIMLPKAVISGNRAKGWFCARGVGTLTHIGIHQDGLEKHTEIPEMLYDCIYILNDKTCHSRIATLTICSAAAIASLEEALKPFFQ